MKKCFEKNLNNMNEDAKLILLTKEELSLLKGQNFDLIEKVIMESIPVKFITDDIIQELSLALCEANLKYSDMTKAKKRIYCKRYLLQTAKTLLLQEQNKKMNMNTENELIDMHRREWAVANDSYQPISLEDQLHEILKNCEFSELERVVLNWTFGFADNEQDEKGELLTPREIARTYKAQLKNVIRIRKRALQKIKENDGIENLRKSL